MWSRLASVEKGDFPALVLGHRDLVLLGEVDQRRAAGQIPLAPRGDHLDVGGERIIAELEPHLVIALAGRAVADRVGADRPRNLDLPLGDQRPRDRGAEQVQPLVQRIGAHHRIDIVADELLAQIVDEDMLGLDPHHLRLGARRLDLLALAEVGGEGHDFAAVGLLQPFEDHAGVEPARIGKDDAADFSVRGICGLGHGPAACHHALRHSSAIQIRSLASRVPGWREDDMNRMFLGATALMLAVPAMAQMQAAGRTADRAADGPAHGDDPDPRPGGGQGARAFRDDGHQPRRLHRRRRDAVDARPSPGHERPDG